MLEGFGPFLAVFAVSGGFIIALYSLWLDGRKRHLRHVERMAMIEKGIAPQAGTEPDDASGMGARRSQRRSGVFMICLGIALAFMFGQNGGAMWIGAFMAMFGVANLVNWFLDERDIERSQPATRQPGSPR